MSQEPLVLLRFFHALLKLVSQTFQVRHIIFQKKKSVNISEIAHKTCSVLVGGVSLGLFLMILPF